MLSDLNMSPPVVRVPVPSGGSQSPQTPFVRVVDASPNAAPVERTGNYDFPFHDTPIVQQELATMGSVITRGSRHGKAELFEQIDADWTNRIPAAVSGDTTPRLNPTSVNAAATHIVDATCCRSN